MVFKIIEAFVFYLTHFITLGQKSKNNFVNFGEQMRTRKFTSEIDLYQKFTTPRQYISPKVNKDCLKMISTLSKNSWIHSFRIEMYLIHQILLFYKRKAGLNSMQFCHSSTSINILLNEISTSLAALKE